MIRKLLRFILVLVILVAAAGGYLLFANGSMFLHALKDDKPTIIQDLNKSLDRYADYGNYDLVFEHNYEQGVVKTTSTGNIRIKLDGQKRYFKSNVTVGSSETKQTFDYYCESIDGTENAILYTSSKDPYGQDYKVKKEMTWEQALMFATGNANSVINFLTNKESCVQESAAENNLQKAKIAISFSPFYVGEKITLLSEKASATFHVGTGGKFRKIIYSNESDTEKFSGEIQTNKPGKAVEIYILSEEEKSSYLG